MTLTHAATHRMESNSTKPTRYVQIQMTDTNERGRVVEEKDEIEERMMASGQPASPSMVATNARHQPTTTTANNNHHRQQNQNQNPSHHRPHHTEPTLNGSSSSSIGSPSSSSAASSSTVTVGGSVAGVVLPLDPHRSLLSQSSRDDLISLNSSLLTEVSYFDHLTRDLSLELETSLNELETSRRSLKTCTKMFEETQVTLEVLKAQRCREEVQREKTRQKTKETIVKLRHELIRLRQELRHAHGRQQQQESQHQPPSHQSHHPSHSGSHINIDVRDDPSSQLNTPSAVSSSSLPSDLPNGIRSTLTTKTSNSHKKEKKIKKDMNKKKKKKNREARARTQVGIHVNSELDPHERDKPLDHPTSSSSSSSSGSDDESSSDTDDVIDDDDDDDDDVDVDDLLGETDLVHDGVMTRLLSHLHPSSSSSSSSTTAVGSLNLIDQWNPNLPSRPTTIPSTSLKSQLVNWSERNARKEKEEQQQQHHPLDSNLTVNSSATGNISSTTSPTPSPTSMVPLSDYMSLHSSHIVALDRIALLEERLLTQQQAWHTYLDLVHASQKHATQHPQQQQQETSEKGENGTVLPERPSTTPASTGTELFASLFFRPVSATVGCQTLMVLNTPSQGTMTELIDQKLVYVTEKIWKALETSKLKEAKKEEKRREKRMKKKQIKTGTTMTMMAKNYDEPDDTTQPDRYIIPFASKTTIARSTSDQTMTTTNKKSDKDADDVDVDDVDVNADGSTESTTLLRSNFTPLGLCSTQPTGGPSASSSRSPIASPSLSSANHPTTTLDTHEIASRLAIATTSALASKRRTSTNSHTNTNNTTDTLTTARRSFNLPTSTPSSSSPSTPLASPSLGVSPSFGPSSLLPSPPSALEAAPAPSASSSRQPLRSSPTPLSQTRTYASAPSIINITTTPNTNARTHGTMLPANPTNVPNLTPARLSSSHSMSEIDHSSRRNLYSSSSFTTGGVGVGVVVDTGVGVSKSSSIGIHPRLPNSSSPSTPQSGPTPPPQPLSPNHYFDMAIEQSNLRRKLAAAATTTNNTSTQKK